VSCDAGGSTGATTYQFDFGDGSPPVDGTSASATHLYVVPGDYTITVTIRDALARADTASTTVSIL
jgi:PKD repeat protein